MPWKPSSRTWPTCRRRPAPSGGGLPAPTPTAPVRPSPSAVQSPPQRTRKCRDRFPTSPARYAPTCCPPSLPAPPDQQALQTTARRRRRSTASASRSPSRSRRRPGGSRSIDAKSSKTASYGGGVRWPRLNAAPLPAGSRHPAYGQSLSPTASPCLRAQGPTPSAAVTTPPHGHPPPGSPSDDSLHQARRLPDAVPSLRPPAAGPTLAEGGANTVVAARLSPRPQEHKTRSASTACSRSSCCGPTTRSGYAAP